MSSDIENYISQARASGQGDEQIRSRLRSAGWTEENIAEAFTTPMTNTSVITTGSWLSIKVLALAILTLVVVGMLAYLIFGRGAAKLDQTATPTPESETVPALVGEPKQTTTSNGSTFECKDLLSLGDFQRITGFTIDDISGIWVDTKLVCGFEGQGLNAGAFIVDADASRAEELYLMQKDFYKYGREDITNLGSAAFRATNSYLFIFWSSNKKYVTEVNTDARDTLPPLDDSETQSKISKLKNIEITLEIAKVINTNLNNY